MKCSFCCTSWSMIFWCFWLSIQIFKWAILHYKKHLLENIFRIELSISTVLKICPFTDFYKPIVDSPKMSICLLYKSSLHFKKLGCFSLLKLFLILTKRLRFLIFSKRNFKIRDMKIVNNFIFLFEFPVSYRR